MHDVALGWSAKRTILGQPVYNDNNERVGSIDDIIIAPDKAISYAIVNAGGFLGLAKHDVAVSVSKFKLVDGKLVLPGATTFGIIACLIYCDDVWLNAEIKGWLSHQGAGDATRYKLTKYQ
jgi:sporulation protein YlmC with PRC-barrel domain